MADAVPSSHIETIRFDARVFSLVAVKKAAYRYLDKFAVEILLEDPEIVCMVKCTRPLSPTRLTELLDDFRKRSWIRISANRLRAKPNLFAD